MSVRKTWQLVTCRETRRAIGQLGVLLAFLWPMLLVAVDHHGGERIPTHEHVDPLGEPVAQHVHAFALEHDHAASGVAHATTISAPPVVRVVVRVADLAAPPLALLASMLLDASSLPLFAVLIALAVQSRMPAPLRPASRAQTSSAPLTPPPRGGMDR